MNSFNTQSAPHVPKKHSVREIMVLVLLALIPAICAYLYFFGWGVLIQIILSIFFALSFECISLKLLNKSMKLFLSDGSAIVTAVLFALCVSPVAPWHISLIGMFFAIVVAKHLYGGLGHNIFNPAMVGFAVVIIAFPQQMTIWLNPELPLLADLSFWDNLQIIFKGSVSIDIQYDAITTATPLDEIRSSLIQGYTISEIKDLPLFGSFAALGWEWIACLYLLGGLFLIYKKVINSRIPLFVILSTILIALPLYLYNPDQFLSPIQHLFYGGTMLAAFFIATDPTSGCSSPRGQIIFAFGVAFFTYLIREFGNYPDGVAFSIVLMNLSAPLIDRLTIPKPYGKKK